MTPIPTGSLRRLLTLYRRIGELPDLTVEVALACWLRLHLLLQTYHTLFAKPCPPRFLGTLWHEPHDLFDARAPTLRFTLSHFPLPRSPLPSLPPTLLQDVSSLYESPVPDLGTLYHLTQTDEQIKRKGQFFTPDDAVEHALGLLQAAPEGRVLDLSCGAGAFLVAIYRRLRRSFEAAGMTAEAAHARILQEHLFGLDLDPWAVAVTRSRLFLECPTTTCLANHIHQSDAFGVFDHPLGRHSYHTIVGNPPWGVAPTSSDKSGRMQEFPSVASAGMARDSFLFFLEASVRLLEEQGQFSLLLPAAFLNRQAYEQMRKWLLERVEVGWLEYTPKLFEGIYAPTVFLTGRRVDVPDPEHAVKMGRDHRNWSRWQGGSQEIVEVPQGVLRRNVQTIFPLQYDPLMEPLLTRMREGAFYLKSVSDAASSTVSTRCEQSEFDGGLVKFALGIITGNNRRHVRSVADHPDCEPLYEGEELYAFHLRPPQRCLVYDKKRLQQAAPQEVYKTPEKLLYRFISKQLVTAIDRSCAYTLNNLNVILPIDLPITLRCLMALLNSKLLNTFYMYHFFTGKVLASNLCELPLRVPSREVTEEIERLVAALEGCETVDSEEYKASVDILNQVIYRLYEFTEPEQLLLEQKYEYLRNFPFV